MIKSYRELDVWNKAMELCLKMYEIVAKFPTSERFALADQIRRAAISVPSNIAEGFGRETTKDFIHFLSMARGSLFELDTQLELSDRIGYFQYDEEVRQNVLQLGKMINGLMAKLKQRLRQPPTTNHQPPTTNL